MGNKVDVEEVISLSDKVSNAKEVINTDLPVVVSHINALNEMDSFKGKSAEIAKYHFVEFHQSIIDAIRLLFIEINSNLEKELTDFASAVDTSERARIKQGYIENEIKALKLLHEDYNSISTKITTVVEDVADLVSVVSPNFSYMNSRNKSFIKTMEELVQNMEIFSNKKNTDEIHNALEHIRTLMNGVQSKSGEARFKTIYKDKANNVKDKLDKWVDKKRGKTAVEHVEEKGAIVTNTLKYAKLGNLAGQAAPMAYVLAKMSAKDRMKYLQTGMHSMTKRDLTRLNNLSTLTNIFKVSKNDLLRLGKQTAKDPKNFLKHLQNGPFSDVRGKKTLKKDYDNLHGLDKYKELKKLSP